MPKPRKLTEILGRGVPDQPASEQRTKKMTSLLELLKILKRQEAAVSKKVPLQNATYNDRRYSGSGGNPDYVGPMKGAGSGTRDKMPGTTPSQSNVPKKSKQSTTPNPKKRKPGIVV